MHGLVPPHPGPLIAIDALHADLGQTLAYGLIVAIPTVIVAGPLYGIWIGRFVAPQPPARLVEEFAGSARSIREDEETTGRDLPEQPVSRPGFVLTLVTILLPVVLMLGRAIADIAAAKGNPVRSGLDALGD